MELFAEDEFEKGRFFPVGPAFQEFVGLCYERCEQIVSMQLQAQSAAAAGQPGPEYSWQFIVCSLDLISGLADGIGPALAAVVTKGQLNILLPQCCKVSAGLLCTAPCVIREGSRVLTIWWCYKASYACVDAKECCRHCTSTEHPEKHGRGANCLITAKSGPKPAIECA